MKQKILLVASNQFASADIVSSIVQENTKLHSVGFIKLDNERQPSSPNFSSPDAALSHELFLAARRHEAYDLTSAIPQGEAANIHAIASRNIVGVLAVHQAELLSFKEKLERNSEFDVKACFVHRDPELGVDHVMQFTAKDSPSPTPVELQCDFILEGAENSSLARQLIFSAMNQFGITTELKACDQAQTALLMTSAVSEEINSIALVAERAANRSKTNASLCLSLSDSIINCLQRHNVQDFGALPRHVQHGIIKDAFSKRQLNSYQMANLLTSSSLPSALTEPNFKALIDYSQFMNLQLARITDTKDLLQLHSVVEHIDNAGRQSKYTGPDRKTNLLPNAIVTALQTSIEKHAQPYANDILEQLALRADGIGLSDRLSSPAATMFYEVSAEMAQRVTLPTTSTAMHHVNQLKM